MDEYDEKYELTLSTSFKQPLFMFFLFSALIDMYSIFSAMYWISVNSFPKQFLLSLEIFVEIYFLFNSRKE